MADCDKVADCFVDLMKAKRGELDAVVTTAEPLTEENVAFVSVCLLLCEERGIKSPRREKRTKEKERERERGG